jgi:hypothetical protein
MPHSFCMHLMSACYQWCYKVQYTAMAALHTLVIDMPAFDHAFSQCPAKTCTHEERAPASFLIPPSTHTQLHVRRRHDVLIYCIVRSHIQHIHTATRVLDFQSLLNMYGAST